MQLLDRYLQAVGTHLPQKKRDDILHELRANILEGVEDREAELGRPLTIEEEEAVLKQCGNPVVVGTRYWPKQYLIGPSLFPYYIYALKTVTPLALVIATVVNLISLSAKTVALETVLGVLGRLPFVIFMTAAWITIAFVGIEFAQPHFEKQPHPFADWNPRKLPPLQIEHGYSVWKTGFEVAVSAIGIAWLLSIPFVPFLMLGPAASQMKYFRLAPEWLTVYWVFIAIVSVQWLSDALTLVEPSWRRYRPFVGMLGRAATAVLGIWLLKVPTYIWLSDLGREAGRPESLVQGINTGLHIGIKFTVLFTFAQLIWEGAKMFKRKNNSGLLSGSTQSAL
jgi:hypothetical protein